jgi:RNA polymerase sigma factor (sigma-70 family)
LELKDINRAISTGNQDAWWAIFPEAFKWLCEYTKKACLSRRTDEQIKEMAQDILLKLLLQTPKPTFASVARFRVYLRTAAENFNRDKNKSAEIIERGARVEKYEPESDQENSEVDELKAFIDENNQANIEEVYLEEEQPEKKSEMERLVNLALQKLAPDEQSLVKERSIGVPYSSLAKQLGAKEPNLKMRHKRALEKLKSHFLSIAREHNYEHKPLRLLEPEQG